jgi:hypothetical protein
VIKKLTPFDIGILVAAAVMALGAFCPIVRLPIVGSLSYVMGGRGDGIFIIACSAAIIALVVSGYRRTTGILAAGALFLMMITFVHFAAELSKAQAALAGDAGPFGGLATLIANSVGLEWGWLLLIGGALAIVILALVAPGEIVPAVDGQHNRTQDDGEGASYASADKKIADYLENRKISPALRAQSTPERIGFGKRRTL